MRKNILWQRFASHTLFPHPFRLSKGSFCVSKIPHESHAFWGIFLINFIMNTIPKIEKLFEFGQKILQIAVDSGDINQQNLTQKAVFDILSLEPNINKIEGNEIFLKNKKRGRGKLNQKKISKILLIPNFFLC